MNVRRLAGFGLGAVVLLVVEGAFGVHLLEARRTADAHRDAFAQTRRELATTSDAIAATNTSLDGTTRTIGTRTKQEHRARKLLKNAKTRETTAARDLAASRLLAAAASLGVDAVRTCADGVGRATIESHGGDDTGAVDALRRAQPACTRVLNVEGSSAVYPFDFSDPSLLRVGDTYYAYSTNNAAGEVQVIMSTDLHTWTLVGDALPQLPRWAAPGNTWAPSVIARGNEYLAYYTVRDAISGFQCVSVAIASEPIGPFVDTSVGPLVCQHELAGSIDPRPFTDASGGRWLLWSSPGGPLPTIIWSQALTPDGRALTGMATPLLKADQTWENGVVEAPALVHSNGALVLFYAGNRWRTPEYAVGEARCASPGGPCLKRMDGPVFVSHDDVIGPGSPDFVATPSGELWMAFAAYRTGHVSYPASRLLHVARVDVDRIGVTFTRK